MSGVCQLSDAPIDIGLPEKMTFADNGSSVENVRTWFGPKFLIMGAFAVVWNGFLVFWYAKAISAANALMLLFPVLHVCIGVGLTYYVVAGFLNKTQVYADARGLYIRHRPVWWFGNRNIDPADLKQLYVKEKQMQGRGGSYAMYEVRAITHSGHNIKIVGGLDAQEQGIFIEQKIEQFFDIENAAVPGEVGR